MNEEQINCNRKPEKTIYSVAMHWNSGFFAFAYYIMINRTAFSAATATQYTYNPFFDRIIIAHIGRKQPPKNTT